MDVERDQIPLPLPPVPDEVALLTTLKTRGFALCSEGAANWETLDTLRSLGLVRAHHCPDAGGTWQFTLSGEGERALLDTEAVPAADSPA
ncbi:MAG TPA: hypothetical protein DD491_08580 [Halieaceae bacterium]|nr:hypothetical protein [Halieaceae bacterium]